MADLSFATVPNPFIFSSHEVRTAVDPASEAWFCAKDVFLALGMAWKNRAGSLKNTPKKWVGACYLQGPGGTQETVFIAEPAVYQVAFRSNKPEAIRFTEWVCEEVLPALRRQGYFGVVTPGVQVQLTQLMIRLVNEISLASNEFAQRILLNRLRAVCNQLGETMPESQQLTEKPQLALPGV